MKEGERWVIMVTTIFLHLCQLISNFYKQPTWKPLYDQLPSHITPLLCTIPLTIYPLSPSSFPTSSHPLHPYLLSLCHHEIFCQGNTCSRGNFSCCRRRPLTGSLAPHLQRNWRRHRLSSMCGRTVWFLLWKYHQLLMLVLCVYVCVCVCVHVYDEQNIKRYMQLYAIKCETA